MCGVNCSPNPAKQTKSTRTEEGGRRFHPKHGLALWLIGLGVEPIWNPPAQPTRNPRVERSNGLTQQWGELRTCTDCKQAARALDWVGRIQREEYPLAPASWCATKGKDTQNRRSVFRPNSLRGSDFPCPIDKNARRMDPHSTSMETYHACHRRPSDYHHPRLRQP